MKNDYEKIRNELVKKGVRIDGFGSWLFLQDWSDRRGLRQRSPYKCLGMFAYERRWEEVYPWLKSQVDDMEDFSKWLLGLQQIKPPLFNFGDVFVRIGQMFATKFRVG